MPTCECGCGAEVRSRFRPGHDAKLKSALIRSAIQGDDPDAERELERLGWTKFLDKARKSRSRQVQPRNTQRQQRQADNQEKAGARLQILNDMKAARDALRELDRSPEVQVTRYNYRHILEDPVGYQPGDELAIPKLAPID